MKTGIMNVIGKTRVLQFALVLGVAVFAMSCEKADSDVVTRSSQATEASTVALKKGAPAPGAESIAAIAIGAGFNELVEALVYVDGELNTGLVDLFLNGKDQYTVFAPTDAAFNNLYSALSDPANNVIIDEITDLPATLVLDVLLYHVVEGRRAANSVVPPVNPKAITTLLGVDFTVNKLGGITAIGNTANITSADISASNGIIHVIDAVILPIN
jgi:uncharacterized surface protein with fasciclin (FAS1) repeats